MSAAIFNPSEFEHPSDAWYMIEPLGEHANAVSGILQVIDAQAATQITDRFNQDADRGQLSHGAEMLIDREHFKYNAERESLAYGWLYRLQARADGIYGQIRWSNTGKDAVDGGDYRFFSTEYDPKDLTILNGAGNLKRARPTRLDGLTLTNTPNNKRGRPITNRRRPSALPPRESDPLADQRMAARLINRLAEAEQRESGLSFSYAYRLVMNRETRLIEVAAGRLTVKDALANERAARGTPAKIAGEIVAGLSRSLRGQSLTSICNRQPLLAKLMNRAAGWDAIEELEPIACEAARGVVESPPPIAMQPAVNSIAPQSGGDANADAQRCRELQGEGLVKLMIQLATEYPDAGFDARWQMAKALFPDLFWNFVLKFQSGDYA